MEGDSKDGNGQERGDRYGHEPSRERGRGRRHGGDGDLRRNPRRGRHGGCEVIDPRVMVFAHLPLSARDNEWSVGAGRRNRTPEISGAGETHNMGESLQRRVYDALERRYPEGARGLRGTYLVYRKRGGSRVLCFGVPQQYSRGAVSIAAMVPRRVLTRRRVVAFYEGDDYIGCMIFEGGVPQRMSGIALRESPERTLDAAVGLVPSDFESARHYLLVDRNARAGPARPARPAGDAALAQEARARGMRVVAKRRRPSSEPKLSGIKRGALRRRRRAFPATANIALATALLIMILLRQGGLPTEEQRLAADRVEQAESAGSYERVELRASTRSRPLSARPPAAVQTIGVLADALEPLTDQLRVEEVYIEGSVTRLHLRGARNVSQRVVRRLGEEAAFRTAVLLSEGRAGSRERFVVELRSAGPGTSNRDPGVAREQESTSWRDAFSLVADTRDTLTAGGLEIEELRRSAAGYRFESVGTKAEIAATVVALWETGSSVRLETLSLTHRGQQDWGLSFLAKHASSTGSATGGGQE